MLVVEPDSVEYARPLDPVVCIAGMSYRLVGAVRRHPDDASGRYTAMARVHRGSREGCFCYYDGEVVTRDDQSPTSLNYMCLYERVCRKESMALLCGRHEGEVARESRRITAAACVQAVEVVRARVRSLVEDLLEDILSACAQVGNSCQAPVAALIASPASDPGGVYVFLSAERKTAEATADSFRKRCRREDEKGVRRRRSLRAHRPKSFPGFVRVNNDGGVGGGSENRESLRGGRLPVGGGTGGSKRKRGVGGLLEREPNNLEVSDLCPCKFDRCPKHADGRCVSAARRIRGDQRRCLECEDAVKKRKAEKKAAEVLSRAAHKRRKLAVAARTCGCPRDCPSHRGVECTVVMDPSSKTGRSICTDCSANITVCSCDGSCGKHDEACMTGGAATVINSKRTGGMCRACWWATRQTRLKCSACEKPWDTCVCAAEILENARASGTTVPELFGMITADGRLCTLEDHTRDPRPDTPAGNKLKDPRSDAVRAVHCAARATRLRVLCLYFDGSGDSFATDDDSEPVRRQLTYVGGGPGPRNDRPSAGLLEEWRNSCVDAELDDVHDPWAYCAAGWIRFTQGFAYDAFHLCLFALEVGCEAPELVNLSIRCLQKLKVGNSALAARPLRFPWARGTTFKVVSMFPRFPEGRTRVGLYAPPFGDGHGTEVSISSPSTEVADVATVPGLLHVPVLVRALLVETLVNGNAISPFVKELCTFIDHPNGHEVSVLALAVRTVWEKAGVDDPTTRVSFWLAKRHLFPERLRCRMDELLKPELTKTAMIDGGVGSPTLVLGPATVDAWLRALRRLSAVPTVPFGDPNEDIPWNHRLAPVTQAEAYAAMRGFQECTSASALDLSRTCASCGVRVSPNADVLDLEDDYVYDMYAHEHACRTGWPRDVLDLVRRRRQHGRESNDVEDDDPLEKGDVVMMHGGDDDELFQGTVTSLRRDGTFGVCFDPSTSAVPHPPVCSITPAWTTWMAARKAYTLRPTSAAQGLVDSALVCVQEAALGCPFGSQLHGLHCSPGGELFVLLREVDWRRHREEAGDESGPSDHVMAWRTSTSTDCSKITSCNEFYACARCASAARRRGPGATGVGKYALVRTEIHLVPPCQLPFIAWRDPRLIQLLPVPSLVLSRMLAVYRTNSVIIRLLSSSSLDRAQSKAGQSAGAPPVRAPVLQGDRPEYKKLQRAHRKHIISFPNPVKELRDKIIAGHVDGMASRAEVLAGIKVVLCGPAYSNEELVRTAMVNDSFRVDTKDFVNWLAVLQAFHLPRFYGTGTLTQGCDSKQGTPGCGKVDKWEYDSFAERCVVFSAENKEASDRFLRGLRGDRQAYSASHEDAPVDGVGNSRPRDVTASSAAVCASGDNFDEFDLVLAGLQNHEKTIQRELDDVGRDRQCASCIASHRQCNHCACYDASHDHIAGKCSKNGHPCGRVRQGLCKSCWDMQAKRGKQDNVFGKDGVSPVPDVAMLRGADPVSEWGEPDLLSGSNPCLFPAGRGLARDSRRDMQYTVPEWRRHLGLLSNRMFAQHHSLMFEVTDMYNRDVVIKTARVRIKQTGQEALLTYNDLKRVACDVRKLGMRKSVELHPHIVSLMRNIRAVAGSIPGSPHARGKYVNTLRGLQTVLGVPSVWLTINLHDLADPHVLLHMGVEVFRLPAPLDRALQARLISADPFAACEWFNGYCVAIIRWLFGDVGGPRRGIFGTVTGYGAVKEAYGRGSLHAHFLVWLKEMGAVLHLLRSAATRGRSESRVASFVDSISCCRLNAVPAKRITTEYCHPECGDEFVDLTTKVSRDMRPCDVGRCVRVRVQPTRKVVRLFDARVQEVHPDGWVGVARHSASLPGGATPAGFVAGTDVDYTEIDVKSKGGVPFNEIRCPVVPPETPDASMLPAFGAHVMEEAYAYHVEGECLESADDLIVRTEKSHRVAGVGVPQHVLASDCQTCAIKRARSLSIPTASTVDARTSARVRELVEQFKAWSGLEGSGCAARLSGRLLVRELVLIAKSFGLATPGSKRGVDRRCALESIVDDLVRSLDSTGRRIDPLAEVGACIHCIYCGSECDVVSGLARSGEENEMCDGLCCDDCAAETRAFMQPFLKQLGGLVVSGLQHGRRLKIPVTSVPGRDRVLRRRCLRGSLCRLYVKQACKRLYILSVCLWMLPHLSLSHTHTRTHTHIHTHTYVLVANGVVCFKYADARKRGVCRLNFTVHGRLLAQFTYIDQDGRVVQERNAYHVVPHSVAGTIVLRCNNSVELVFSGKSANAISLYITSYMVKGVCYKNGWS